MGSGAIAMDVGATNDRWTAAARTIDERWRHARSMDGGSMHDRWMAVLAVTMSGGGKTQQSIRDGLAYLGCL